MSLGSTSSTIAKKSSSKTSTSDSKSGGSSKNGGDVDHVKMIVTLLKNPTFVVGLIAVGLLVNPYQQGGSIIEKINLTSDEKKQIRSDILEKMLPSMEKEVQNTFFRRGR